MMNFSLLGKITGGDLIKVQKDYTVSELIIDSRKAGTSEGALFIAIKGVRHNGHEYLEALYNRGLRQFVVEETPDDLSRFPEANFLKVNSTVAALQDISAFHRAQFNIPIIGITGSNGKTIIKEWLFQLLSSQEIVVKNPGSYNSQVGVPLAVWQIQKHHTIGIFEAGISRKGEMENLEKIIRPSLGIFTNIGSAHDEGFSDLKEKAEEKLQLFKEVHTLIYCRDHVFLHDLISRKNIPTLSWGFSETADIKINKTESCYRIEYNGFEFSISIPFEDSASIENCFHCIALLLQLGFEPALIANGIRNLRRIPMRLELKEAINQCHLIDDTYNNDLGGLEISLQFLAHQRQKKKKAVILSDVLETGLPEKKLIEKIVALFEKYGVDRFIGIGPVLSSHRLHFVPSSKFFASTSDFLRNFDPEIFHDEVILVKGARVFHFEEITRKLQRKVHGTIMEINLDALVHNFNFIKSKLDRSTKIMVMVKAFAYGSGSNEIANLLQFHKADYLGVAYPDEGIELRKNNISLPIMVMNSSEESFEQLLSFNLEPEIYNFKILNAWLNFLNDKPAIIHLKLDTGMRRLGFEEEQLNLLIPTLSDHPNVKVASVFSHLAGADESTHDKFSHLQAEVFKRCADKISMAIGYKPLYHLLNSSGILRLPQFQYDMVRLGIGLYGVDPTVGGQSELKTVATLKTIVSQIKKVKRGETVGYGRKGVADKDLTLGTIAIGYADGFNRAFSRGVGEVLVNGQRAPVMGNVCMDMTMVDLTGITATEGDEVIIFGNDLPIQEVAQRINTIPYEILTNTSERVKRIFTTESI